MIHAKIAIRTLFFALAILGFSMQGCKKDKETEAENITRIVVHLTGTGGSTFDQEFTWEDRDGDGGAAPSIDNIVIPAAAGSVFNCRLHVYDDTKTPVSDVTEEIEAESAAHLFTFVVSGGVFTIGGFNLDSNGKTFGLESVWTKGAAGTGTVNVVLRHEPSNKDDLSNPGGDTDFDVTFPVTIQ